MAAVDKEIKDLDLNSALDDADNIPLQNGATDETERTTIAILQAKMIEDVEFRYLGRHTLGVAGDTLTVSGLTAKKYLRVKVSLIPSGAILARLTLNNDTGANYALRYDNDNGGTGTAGSQSNFGNIVNGVELCFATIDILNIATQEKIIALRSITNATNGAANIPHTVKLDGKWANTSNQVTRIDIVNAGAGDFAIGSELLVYGHD